MGLLSTFFKRRSQGALNPLKETIRIRPEEPGDADAIHHLTAIAFAPMPFSGGAEPEIIRVLRQAGDLTLSLVAEEDGSIVGHVAFSPVSIGGRHDGWFGLGPISVRPDRQRQGIGRALVDRGLSTLRARGARGCALIGNPDIYRRMGFESDGRLRYANLDARYVQRLVFDGEPPQGDLAFAPAFDLDRPPD